MEMMHKFVQNLNSLIKVEKIMKEKNPLCYICKKHEAIINFEGRLKIYFKCLSNIVNQEIKEDDDRRKSRT